MLELLRLGSGCSLALNVLIADALTRIALKLAQLKRW